MRRLNCAVLAAVVAVACGGDPTPDDATLHQDIVQDRAGAEVTFDATVLADPTSAPGHEHIQVRAGSGDILEIDHNVNLARPVPAHTGDQLTVHGQLYIDSGRAGVHCTHAHTSSGCP
ncbi:MAG TPA: hypothetical protein VF160_14020, partial [Candidatus Dormibacteraeota bacterium]